MTTTNYFGTTAGVPFRFWEKPLVTPHVKYNENRLNDFKKGLADAAAMEIPAGNAKVRRRWKVRQHGKISRNSLTFVSSFSEAMKIRELPRNTDGTATANIPTKVAAEAGWHLNKSAADASGQVDAVAADVREHVDAVGAETDFTKLKQVSCSDDDDISESLSLELEESESEVSGDESHLTDGPLTDEPIVEAADGQVSAWDVKATGIRSGSGPQG
jgi:hypothetical protein